MLSKLVKGPTLLLAEYLLEKFVGKYVENIDLKKEGTSFDKAQSTITLPDLNLNCRVSLFYYFLTI